MLTLYGSDLIIGQEISLADIILLAFLEPAEMAKVDLNVCPRLAARRTQLKKQPFYTNCYKEYGEMLKAPAMS